MPALFNHSIWKTASKPLVALIINLLLAYGVFAIARIIFLLENFDTFQQGLSLSHCFRLFLGGLKFDTTAVIYTHLLYMFLMAFPFAIKETKFYQRCCKILFLFVNGCCLALNLCDAAYFPYTLRRTTTSVLHEFSNETNLAAIIGKELVGHWYFVLIFIVVMWLLHKAYRMPHFDTLTIRSRREKIQYFCINFAAMALLAVFCVGGARGGLQSGVRPITISNANEYVKRPIECALVLNTPFALIRTIGKNVFTVPPYYNNLAEAEQHYSPIKQAKSKPTPNKKNIVILIVESFGREYIGAYNSALEQGQYKGYTPNVDKLIAKSCVFEYSFANGHKSIDGMPSVLCSIPMFVEPFVLTPASMNSYTGIPGHLAKWGYQTAFFHGANRGSMGFLAFANKIGFQSYYGRQDYAADKRFGGDADFDGNWGIWDEPFLQYYCAKMNEMKQPFMTAVFTVSSHHPFEIPKKYQSVFKAGKLPIHKCIQYTDMAIGKFFETAQKQTWFSNTIFVITSDHTNQSYYPMYKTDLGEFAAPLIIYDPSGNIAPERRKGIAQQIDILPTIMGIIGYDKSYMSFGNDLFNTPNDKTYALNYINGVYQYTKNGFTLQFDGRKTVGLYKLSDTLMQHNLVNKLPQQKVLEQELKAIIYQYMYRMVNDKMQ